MLNGSLPGQERNERLWLMTITNAKVNRCEFLSRAGPGGDNAARDGSWRCWFVAGPRQPEVLINELMATTSEQRLSWDAGGVPRLGSGPQWVEWGFDVTGWTSAFLPAGYGFTGLASDLTSRMKGLAPSLYLRKEFPATAGQAASTNALVLSVRCQRRLCCLP